jgi:hypothetical protein
VPHDRAPEVRTYPHCVLSSIVGGRAVAADFGLSIDPGRAVVGALKFAWRVGAVRFRHTATPSPVNPPSVSGQSGENA